MKKNPFECLLSTTTMLVYFVQRFQQIFQTTTTTTTHNKFVSFPLLLLFLEKICFTSGHRKHTRRFNSRNNNNSRNHKSRPNTSKRRTSNRTPNPLLFPMVTTFFTRQKLLVFDVSRFHFQHKTISFTTTKFYNLFKKTQY